jgi:hypothetical protein
MLAPHQLEQLRKSDLQAWQSGQRVLQVPTYFAFAAA